jgi:hypothetical protein
VRTAGRGSQRGDSEYFRGPDILLSLRRGRQGRGEILLNAEEEETEPFVSLKEGTTRLAPDELVPEKEE